MQGHFTHNPLHAVFWSGAWMLALAFVFSFFTTMLMLATPMFLLLIYDRVLSARSEETLAALFGLVVVLLILLALLDYSRRRILARFGARLQEQLELKVLGALDERGPRSALGAALVSGTRDLDRLRSFFHSGALIAVLDIFWAPIFLGAVFLFHPLLGWVASLGVLLLICVSCLRVIGSAHLGEEADLASGKMNALGRRLRDAQETLGSQRMADAMVERWRAVRGRTRDMSIVLADRVTWFKSGSMLVRLFFQALILALGAYLNLENELTIGGMVACFILIGRVFAPVETFLKSLATIRSVLHHWQQLSMTLQADRDDDDAAPITLSAGTISASNVQPECGTRLLFPLGGVSFSVTQGEVLQISGGIGSGKSVLARALAGQVPLRTGSICIDGRNIEQFEARELSRIIGYVPEDIGFVSGTVFQNISQMRANVKERDVVSAARQAGAHAMILGLTHGYGTQLDAVGSGLSRGERQRIALARALFRQPPILVLDENAEVLPAKSGVLNQNGPAIVLLCRSPRRFAVGSRHLCLEHGQLTNKPDIPALGALTTRLATAQQKIAKG